MNTSRLLEMRRRTPEQWRVLVAEHEQMDESIADFARRAGCKESTVMRHLHNKAARSDKPASVKFAAVRVVSPATAQTEVHLEGQGGVRAVFSRLPPPEYLAAVLGAGDRVVSAA